MAAPDVLSYRPDNAANTGNEREPFPHYPILILGAGQGTGAEIAKEFAKQGYQVIIGTRSQEKFEAVAEEIRQAGGTEPQSFIADITDPAQVEAAYNSLNLEPGTPLHFFPIAAGGFERMWTPVVKAIVPINKAAKNNWSVTKEMFETATANIKTNVLKPETSEFAFNVNVKGTLYVAGLLARRGHLAKESKTVYTSSSGSDNTDPDHPEDYQGPWFYWPIGSTKQLAVQGLEEIVAQTGGTFINTVAPEILGTDVGKLLDLLVSLCRLIGEEVEVPTVTKDQVARAIYLEATRKTGDKNRKIYVTDHGVFVTQPEEFRKPLSPYL